MTNPRPWAAGIASLLNALSAILPQAFGLLLLDAGGYGRFSLVYLVFAAGTSTVFSVVSEAWARTWKGRRTRPGWEHYSSALLRLSLSFGSIGIVLAVVGGVGVLGTGLATLAIVAQVFRTGSRYYEAHLGEWRRVSAGDVANVVGTSGSAVLAMALGSDPLSSVLASWAGGGVAALLFARRIAWYRGRSLRGWLAVHRRAIRPLLADSVLLDIGAVGTPYILVPILGVGGFGVYRAVSNVAIPVQLILNPLRPSIAGSPPSRLCSAKVLLSLLTMLTAGGVVCYAILVWLPTLPFRVGVLSDLHLVALPAALFVPANGMSFYLYLVARAHAESHHIFRARVAQTVLAVLGPVAGALGDGLVGAVWGFSGSALVFTVIWWFAITKLDHGVSAAPSSEGNDN